MNWGEGSVCDPIYIPAHPLRMGTCHTVISMDGYPITIVNFASFPTNLLQEAETCLQTILRGLQFPEFEKIVSSSFGSGDPTGWIKDDLRNKDPGYSFVSNPRNPFRQFSESLLRAIMDE